MVSGTARRVDSTVVGMTGILQLDVQMGLCGIVQEEKASRRSVSEDHRLDEIVRM
ncbi:hypothetical protein M413DRAFT_442853 [Hebeloma cylindrosporum]|uniref:Uncharacterized protein n=1 Tax=Hebeloma cylindrosporum TaxID=76867 RepID=A0A0C3C7P7_HEBCY|nr:hypothetical protein M413DRAFT_442853 [Hebeloma cylindrosporum h7]